MNHAALKMATGTAIAVLLSAVTHAGALPKGVRDTYNKPVERQYAAGCGADQEHQLYFDGPSRLWPPNHKYYAGSIAVTAVDTDSSDGDGIDLTSTGTHNQYDGDTEWNGSGHTADDATLADGEDAEVTSPKGAAQLVANDVGNGTVSIGWKIRAERSGHKVEGVDGEGRVYKITGLAKYSDGSADCTGEWAITVPHDMSVKNR